MNICDMTADDWAAVAHIYQEGIDTGLATFQPNIPSYQDWDQAHLKDCRLVAVENDTVLGWIALSPVSSRCVYAGVCEVSMYVATQCRKKGVGTLLLQAALAQSESLGIWTLQSVIMENNLPSIQLHEKCGFRMVGYRERIGKDNTGAWRNTVLMEHRCDSDEVGDAVHAVSNSTSLRLHKE